eukprot:25227_4
MRLSCTAFQNSSIVSVSGSGKSAMTVFLSTFAMPISDAMSSSHPASRPQRIVCACPGFTAKAFVAAPLLIFFSRSMSFSSIAALTSLRTPALGGFRASQPLNFHSPMSSGGAAVSLKSLYMSTATFKLLLLYSQPESNPHSFLRDNATIFFMRTASGALFCNESLVCARLTCSRCKGPPYGGSLNGKVLDRPVPSMNPDDPSVYELAGCSRFVYHRSGVPASTTRWESRITTTAAMNPNPIIA